MSFSISKILQTPWLNLLNLSKAFLVLCFVIKIAVSLFGYLDPKTNELKFSFSFNKLVNNDESELASRAYNLIHGKGLVKTIQNNDSLEYKLSSNRPLLNVGIHYLYQKIYTHFAPVTELEIFGDISGSHKTNGYYFIYAQLVNLITLILFLVSVPFFISLLKNLGIKDQSLLNLSAGFYLLFPSSLIYIGSIPLYENICFSSSVIGISFLIKRLTGNAKNDLFTFFTISIMLTLSVMLRPQILIPVLLTMAVFGIFILIRTKKEGLRSTKNDWRFVLVFCFVFSTLQSGVIYTNYKYFNSIFYTNRADAFMWGHYELAKGSWDGTVDIKGSYGYNYEREIIPRFDELSEIEQNNAQKKIANNWIKNNIVKEIKLSFKKVAIFFLPYNFERLKVNLPMLIIHLGFFLFIFISIIKRHLIKNNPYILLPLFFIFGILMVNILFFVEYRVKYFADPFMLILTIIALKTTIEWPNGKRLYKN